MAGTILDAIRAALDEASYGGSEFVARKLGAKDYDESTTAAKLGKLGGLALGVATPGGLISGALSKAGKLRLAKIAANPYLKGAIRGGLMEGLQEDTSIRDIIKGAALGSITGGLTEGLASQLSRRAIGSARKGVASKLSRSAPGRLELETGVDIDKLAFNRDFPKGAPGSDEEAIRVMAESIGRKGDTESAAKFLKEHYPIRIAPSISEDRGNISLTDAFSPAENRSNLKKYLRGQATQQMPKYDPDQLARTYEAFKTSRIHGAEVTGYKPLESFRDDLMFPGSKGTPNMRLTAEQEALEKKVMEQIGERLTAEQEAKYGPGREPIKFKYIEPLPGVEVYGGPKDYVTGMEEVKRLFGKKASASLPWEKGDRTSLIDLLNKWGVDEHKIFGKYGEADVDFKDYAELIPKLSGKDVVLGGSRQTGVSSKGLPPRPDSDLDIGGFSQDDLQDIYKASIEAKKYYPNVPKIDVSGAPDDRRGGVSNFDQVGLPGGELVDMPIGRKMAKEVLAGNKVIPRNKKQIMDFLDVTYKQHLDALERAAKESETARMILSSLAPRERIKSAEELMRKLTVAQAGLKLLSKRAEVKGVPAIGKLATMLVREPEDGR